MELAEEEDCFHVFGYLKKLRQSRKGLIENVVSVTVYAFVVVGIIVIVTLIELSFQIKINLCNSKKIEFT